MIRVLGFDGGLLYQAWNDGALHGATWLAEAGVIVACGMNSERRWDERGEEVGESTYPGIVLAVQPRSGRISRHWLVRDGRKLDPSLHWYKWLGPVRELAALASLDPRLGSAAGSWDRSGFATIQFFTHLASRPRSLFTVTLDPTGTEVDRVVNDDHRIERGRGRFPPVETFRLLDYSELPEAR